jgi:hypothetical protein
VRSVAEIIGARASAKRLKHLAALAKLDLICFEDWAQPGRDRPPTAGPRQLRDANPDGRALAVWTAEPTALAEGTAHPQAGLGGPLNLADVMEKTRELERQRARGSAEGELSGSLPGIVRVAASLLRRGPSQGRDPSG